MRLIISICLSILSCSFAYGQGDSINFFGDESLVETEQQVQHEKVDPSSLEATKNHSTKRITVQKFDDSKWRKVVGNTEYDGERKQKKKEKDQQVEQADQDVEKQNRDRRRASQEEQDRYEEDQYEEDDEQNVTTASSSWGGPFIQVLFYIIVIGIILTILFVVFRNSSWRSNPKRQQEKTVDATAQIDDISELEVDPLLKRALTAEDYRLAIRIYFLGLLKKLNASGLIVWKKDKTNRDYLGELFTNQQYFAEVRSLTLAYEQIWYGEHDLPIESLQQLMSAFQAIDQKLNTSRPL